VRTRVIEAGSPPSPQIDHDHIRTHKGVDVCVESYVLIVPGKSAHRRLWSPSVNHRHVIQLLPLLVARNQQLPRSENAS
jgi:hypothetical protein